MDVWYDELAVIQNRWLVVLVLIASRWYITCDCECYHVDEFDRETGKSFSDCF